MATERHEPVEPSGRNEICHHRRRHTDADNQLGILRRQRLPSRLRSKQLVLRIDATQRDLQLRVLVGVVLSIGRSQRSGHRRLPERVVFRPLLTSRGSHRVGNNVNLGVQGEASKRCGRCVSCELWNQSRTIAARVGDHSPEFGGTQLDCNWEEWGAGRHSQTEHRLFDPDRPL